MASARAWGPGKRLIIAGLLGHKDGRTRRPKKDIDMRTKKEQEQTTNIFAGDNTMVRLARESLALASVVGFVWMVCQAAQFAA